jgi:hypothetical protein
MKKTLLIAFCMAFSFVSYAEDKAKNSPSQTPAKGENQDEVIIGFTQGDQTDIFAIPLDDDQLGQEEELNYFEKESKEYLEKNKKAQSINK